MTNEKFTRLTVENRCNTAAVEITPDLPLEGTLDAWQAFLDDLEDFDTYDAAWQEVDCWDWTIYTHYGMKILDVIRNDELCDAEAQWHEMDGPSSIDESFGVYEFASKVAYFFLVRNVTSLTEALLEELKEIAQNEIDNRESA